MPLPSGQQNPYAAFALPSAGGGQPIVISPVFNQNVGDITAGGGPGFAPHHQAGPAAPPAPTRAPPGYAITPTPFDDGKKDLLLAESKEKLRSIQQMIKATKKSQDREQKTYEAQLRYADDQLDRERLEFSRERASIVTRYEQALMSKDQSHKDTVDHVTYLAAHFGNGRMVEMEKPMHDMVKTEKIVIPTNVRSRPRA